MIAKLSTKDREKLDKKIICLPRSGERAPRKFQPCAKCRSTINQVKGLSDDDRDAAWKRIKAAAKKVKVTGGIGVAGQIGTVSTAGSTQTGDCS